jgi:predicted proteasome-type protease
LRWNSGPGRLGDVADTRTNAGVDNISTFRKLHVFKDPKKRESLFAPGRVTWKRELKDRSM